MKTLNRATKDQGWLQCTFTLEEILERNSGCFGNFQVQAGTRRVVFRMNRRKVTENKQIWGVVVWDSLPLWASTVVLLQTRVSHHSAEKKMTDLKRLQTYVHNLIKIV